MTLDNQETKGERILSMHAYEADAGAVPRVKTEEHGFAGNWFLLPVDAVEHSAALLLDRERLRGGRSIRWSRVDLWIPLGGVGLATAIAAPWILGRVGDRAMLSALLTGFQATIWLPIFLQMALPQWVTAMLLASWRRQGLLEDVYLAGDRPVVIFAAAQRIASRAAMRNAMALLAPPAFASLAILGGLLATVMDCAWWVAAIPLVFVTILVAGLWKVIATSYKRSPSVRVPAAGSWMFLAGGGSLIEAMLCWSASAHGPGVAAFGLLPLVQGAAPSIVTGAIPLAFVLAVVVAFVVLLCIAFARMVGGRQAAMKSMGLEQFEELFLAYSAKQDVRAAIDALRK